MSDICYQLRRSSRAKHARIIIKPSHQIEVVLPLRMAKSEADTLVQAQRQWIKRTLARMQQQRPLETSRFPESIALPAIAECIHVVYVEKQKKAMLWNSDGLQLSICKDILDDGELVLYECLRNWLKMYAKEHLPGLLQAIATEMQMDYRGVSIRLQKGRWGSCSMQKNISLNAKLLLLPTEIVRYVLVHELSHIQHMNHSAAFWQYVERFESDYRKRRVQLRQLSVSLPAWVYR